MRAAAWAAIVVPALLLLLYVWIYGVNGPEWDHANSADIFSRWDAGTFTLEFLFRQHNEHRKAVPRLVILALGKLTRWNNRAEMFAHAGLMCGTALILFGALRRELGATATRLQALLLFIPIALLSLSPRSYDALVGDGFPHYLSIIFYVAALRILVLGRRAPLAVAGAIVCAVAASFSISNALLVWPVGLGVLLAEMHLRDREGSLATRILMWTVAGAVTIGAYFYGYHDPGNHTAPSLALEHPTLAIEHFVLLNGSVFSAEHQAAFVFGAIALVLDAVVIVEASTDWWRYEERPPFGFWLLLMTLLSEAMITLNRFGFGVNQALASRYAAMLAFAPVGTYWCLVVRRPRWRVAPALVAPAATLMIVGYLAVTLDAWAAAPLLYSQKSWQAYLMWSAKYQPDSVLTRLYPNPDHARAYSAALERLGLNVFAEPHVQPQDLAVSLAAPEFHVETVNARPLDGTPLVVAAGDPISVSGVAYNDTQTGPPPAIFLTVDGTQNFPAHPGVYRDILGGRIRHRGRRWAGFTGSFNATLLAPGDHTLALRIVKDDGRQAYVTEPIVRVIRR
jgi:hypothetical protein